MRFRVTDTQKKAGDRFVHVGTVEEGTLKPGLALSLEVDHARRGAIRANHSATHLLHEALRQVLGDHVAQKGSLVAPDRLRFDFSHPKPMSADEIEQVEDIANDFVLQNSPVTTRLMALDEAIAVGRARAVRREIRRRGARRRDGRGRRQHHGLVGRAVRRHPCAAHRRHRARSRSWRRRGVAAGVRRIEALTGAAARKAARHSGRAREDGGAELKAPLEELPARIAQVMDERTQARTRAGRGEEEARHGRRRRRPTPPTACASVGDIKLLARAVEGIELKDLRSLADEGKKQVGSGVVAIVGKTEDGKAGVVVGVTADLTERFSAVDLVRKGAEALGGKGGGGRPDMAQAGGPDGSKADAALAAIEAALGG